MLAWLAGKSLWILTVVGELMEEVPFQERIIPRWTVLLLMLLVGWQNPLLKAVYAEGFLCRYVFFNITGVIQRHVSGRAFSNYLLFFFYASVCKRVDLLVTDSYDISIVLGLLCYWSFPSIVYLHFPLWHLSEEWERAIRDCEEEFWPPPWGHCQVKMVKPIASEKY